MLSLLLRNEKCSCISFSQYVILILTLPFEVYSVFSVAWPEFKLLFALLNVEGYRKNKNKKFIVINRLSKRRLTKHDGLVSKGKKALTAS